ncbi:MAG: Minf_1886 family protein [Verrucomicrobiales bacterium]
MDNMRFQEAVDLIRQTDRRFDSDAYHFVKDALEFTLKKKRKGVTGPERHVSPPELLDGMREYALQEYGPMVPTVFEFWGVQSTRDLGALVFNLINIGAFKQSNEDRLEDFVDVFDFREAFVVPFEPRKPAKKENSPPATRPALSVKEQPHPPK